jgi:NAD-dependent deacetylase
MQRELDLAIHLLRSRRRILAFTGAGISTESGIPDFRGPNGVWTKVDPNEFTYDKYLNNPETRKRSWKMRSGSGILDSEPNRAHRSLAAMWEAGRLAGCVTQNIDGLHQAGGLPDEAVVEVHGNARTARCLECHRSWPTPEIVARVEAGDEDPHCPDCGGIIKVAVISFGEAMPEIEMVRAFDLATAADSVISIGSTLSVYPAAYVPLEASQRGVPYVIVNRGDTEHDRIADVKVDGNAGDAMEAIAGALIG